LKVEHLLYLTNGTVALQIALKAFGLTGEIITTPFSYVATTSSIVWEGCQPIMVDIDPLTLNIDVQKIEEKITPRTQAILATHVFGNPCQIEEIAALAQKYNLRVIYDAAHGFGTNYKGKSLYAYGDISTASFHATKLFHTVEGGAVFCQDAALNAKMALLRNFGHTSPTSFEGIGINGKNSEFHAAMGLVNLKSIAAILDSRKVQYLKYLANFAGLPVQFQKITDETDYNHAYFPLILKDETTLLKIIELLNLHHIFPRRYFYPSLSQLNYVTGQSTPVSEDIAKRIICLPIYFGLSHEEIDMISRLVKQVMEY
jgi:dTDP-4-amino-4,6-dideoxygalactose transaminase